MMADSLPATHGGWLPRLAPVAVSMLRPTRAVVETCFITFSLTI